MTSLIIMFYKLGTEFLNKGLSQCCVRTHYYCNKSFHVRVGILRCSTIRSYVHFTAYLTGERVSRNSEGSLSLRLYPNPLLAFVTLQFIPKESAIWMFQSTEHSFSGSTLSLMFAIIVWSI